MRTIFQVVLITLALLVVFASLVKPTIDTNIFKQTEIQLNKARN